MNAIEKLKAENAALRARIAERDEQETIDAFTRDLSESVLIVLGNMPLCDWPPRLLAALDHTERKRPFAAKLYKARLPLM